MANSVTLGSRKRLEWVDVAKAIAIILMVVGHEVNNLNVHTLIFSFHMPLFFILSGYTSSRINNWQKFLRKTKKSFTHVWLLALLMVILLGIENLIFLKGFNFIDFYQSIIRGVIWGSNIPAIGLMSVGVMWFLFVFFWAKLLFDGLQVFLPDVGIGIVLFITSGASYLFCNNFKHYLPQALDIVPFAALFMWIGSVAKKAVAKKQVNSWMKWVAGLALIYWIGCLVLHLNIEMSIRHYPLFVVTILEAAAGTLLVCLLSKWVVSFYWTRTLQIIGQHTLAILCIHHLDLYWINWGQYIHWWPLAALIRLIVDLILLWLFIAIKSRYVFKVGK